MRFSPQPRAIFRHLSFKKWSEHAMFCTFWLANAVRATAMCVFFASETFKIGPSMRCSVQKMRFAPQRRAFWHLNFTNWPEPEAVSTFDLKMRFAQQCHFSFLCWTAASAPAALARLLFEHQEPRSMKKRSDSKHLARVYLLSSDFTRVLIFFLLTRLLYLAFQLSIYCRKLDF